MDPTSLTSAQIADAVRSGDLTARAVVDAHLSRIDRLDTRLRAFLDTFHEPAKRAADEIDRRRASGAPLGPLAGVPVALKDNICLDEGRTTCASRMLEGYRSPFAATAATRLIDAGAIIIGKTNLDEFAMGSSCERSAFAPTRNPWDQRRVPGGSSGGSAAAVAASLAPAALGSDTGGSVRQPASFCGIVGLKPTYGRVSRWGLVAYASSLDQIGPMARTVQDCALLLDAIAGRDELDATTASHPHEPCATSLDSLPETLTVGVPPQAASDALDPASRAAFDRALDILKARGARTLPIDLPHADHSIAAYYIVATAEASSNLARFDGVRYGRRATLTPNDSLEDLYRKSRSEGFGPEVRRRIMLGTYVLSSGYYDAYYRRALQARRTIKADYDQAFARGCHAVLTPTTPGPAFKLGEKLDDPLALYLEDVFTVGANLAGLPAISVPAGFAEREGSRLPVGVQLTGPAWHERDLLAVAHAIERDAGCAGQTPPV